MDDFLSLALAGGGGGLAVAIVALYLLRRRLTRILRWLLFIGLLIILARLFFC